MDHTGLEPTAYLVLVFLLGVERPPVTFTVPLVLILVPTGVGGQQSAQQSQAKKRLWSGDWLGGGESIHQETEAACQHHDLRQQQPQYRITITPSLYPPKVHLSKYKLDQIDRPHYSW